LWLPYGAFGSHSVPSTSYTLQSGSHTAHMAPIWCTQLPHGPHMVHSSPMAPIASLMLSSGSHTSPIQCTWLTDRAHGRIRCTQHPYGECGSHIAHAISNLVHTAPIQCMQLTYGMWLLYGSRGPIGCMELLYGSIHRPCGSIWLPYGTCGSHTAHTTPIWPPFGIHAAPIW
jgi:hypothetical protein